MGGIAMYRGNGTFFMAVKIYISTSGWHIGQQQNAIKW